MVQDGVHQEGVAVQGVVVEAVPLVGEHAPDGLPFLIGQVGVHPVVGHRQAAQLEGGEDAGVLEHGSLEVSRGIDDHAHAGPARFFDGPEFRSGVVLDGKPGVLVGRPDAFVPPARGEQPASGGLPVGFLAEHQVTEGIELGEVSDEHGHAVLLDVFGGVVLIIVHGLAGLEAVAGERRDQGGGVDLPGQAGVCDLLQVFQDGVADRAARLAPEVREVLFGEEEEGM